MTLQQLLEKVENIEKYFLKITSKEQEEYTHKLMTELIKYGDKIVEPISKYLESNSPIIRDFCLDTIYASKNEKFIPELINFLKRNGNNEDGFCEEVAQAVSSIGGSSKARDELKKGFENKDYNIWLVEASIDNSDEGYDFIENIVEDFINNYKKYEDWFYIDHFIQYMDRSREKSFKLIKEVLKLNLTREEKIKIRMLIEGSENLEKQIEQQLLIFKIGIIGAICSPATELVIEGERPVINDSNLKEYMPILYEIERAIVEFYKKNPGLRDGEILKSLKNLRDNIWNSDYAGDTKFEKYILYNLKAALFHFFELNYTKGEISACLSYILNSVKRHRNYEESYLEFIKKQFEEEEKENLTFENTP